MDQKEEGVFFANEIFKILFTLEQEKLRKYKGKKVVRVRTG
jgi:hypothetical protein